MSAHLLESQMVRLRATDRISYGGKRQVAGDVFKASQKDARLLIVLKKAEYYVEPPAPVSAPVPAPAPVSMPRPRTITVRRSIAEKVEVPVEVPAEQSDPISDAGVYLRRDMVAKD